MSNRISSNMMYDQSVSLMLSKQSKMNHLEQQLATGKKIVTAKDDPVASGTAVNLDRVLAEMEQLGKNANTAQNRLGLQENTLAQANELLSRVSELTVQANNAALSTEDRKTVSAELQAIKDQMLALANTTDGNGRYLFGGAADGAAPADHRTHHGAEYNAAEAASRHGDSRRRNHRRCRQGRHGHAGRNLQDAA